MCLERVDGRRNHRERAFSYFFARFLIFCHVKSIYINFSKLAKSLSPIFIHGFRGSVINIGAVLGAHCYPCLIYLMQHARASQRAELKI